MLHNLRRRLRGTVGFVILVLCCSRCIFVSGDEIGFGQPIKIAEKGGEFSNSGVFTLTVDGVHLVHHVSEYLENGMAALGIQCVIENVSYQVWYDSSSVLSPYDVSQHVRVVDSEGFTCEFYNLEDSTGDGKYAIGADVRRGDKTRNTLIYLVDPAIEKFEIRIDEYTYHCRLNDQDVGELVREGGRPEEEEDAAASSADIPKKEAKEPGNEPAEPEAAAAEPAQEAGDDSALMERLEALEEKLLELEERIGPPEKTEPEVYSEETVRRYETALTGYFKLANELKSTGDLVICDVVYYPPKNMVVFEYSTEKTYDDYVEYAAYMEGEAEIDTYYAKGYYNKPVCERMDWADILRYNDTQRG